MNTAVRWFLVVIAIAAAGFGGYWFGQHRTEHGASDEPTTQPAEDEKPVAHVVTAPLKQGPIEQAITVYGTVVAQPGDVRVLSVPFESRVAKILVTAGQQVEAGTDLVQIEPSPDALVALAEAKNAIAAAERDFAQTQQRFKDQLATNAELSTAQQAHAAAKLKMDALTKRGVAESQKLKAEAPGIVNKIDVQEGQIVPAGAALVETASGKSVEIALGVEPGDAQEVKPGQEVQLTPSDASNAAAVVGKVRIVARRVDPATRLATVLVTPPADTHWMLDSSVVGRFTRAAANGLIVPRDAVLPDEGGKFTLFTVARDHAAKHTVKLGLENDHEAQVIAEDLKPGDAVVVSGNYVLTDGMQVEVDPAEGAPATTAPSGAPATSGDASPATSTSASPATSPSGAAQ